MEDKVNELTWNAENTARFWRYYASQSEFTIDEYFTNQVGRGVAEFLSFVTPLKGKLVLDYGCGLGFLIPHLLDRGAAVTGADVSQESVDAVNAKFAGKPGWQGAKQSVGAGLGLPEGTFDIIICLETIEHVFARDLEAMLASFYELLRPGGFVLFSVPNDENLRRNHMYCPNCNTSFHKMQHLTSWNAPQLREFLQSHGFDVRFCTGLNFHSFQLSAPRDWQAASIRDLKRSLKHKLLQTVDGLAPRDFPHGRLLRHLLEVGGTPHLVAVAAKPLGK